MNSSDLIYLSILLIPLSRILILLIVRMKPDGYFSVPQHQKLVRNIVAGAVCIILITHIILQLIRISH